MGGLAGGLLFLGGLATLLSLSRGAPLPGLRDRLVLPLVVASAAVLTADLTHPARFFRLLVTFRASSPVSWGSWILALSGLAGAVLAAPLADGWPLVSPVAAPLAALRAAGGGRAADLCGLVAGVGLAGYTGILLSASSRLRWFASPHLGGAFLATGSASAAALAFAVGGPEGAGARLAMAALLAVLAGGLVRSHLQDLAAAHRAGRLAVPLPGACARWLAAASGLAALGFGILGPVALAAGSGALRALAAAAGIGADLALRFAVFWMEESPDSAIAGVGGGGDPRAAGPAPEAPLRPPGAPGPPP
jgi:hypothetical protein